MTTLTFEDLFEDGMDMVLRLAEADTEGFLTRVARHAGAFVSVCSWCKAVTGVKDGGDRITHGICEPCRELFYLEAYPVNVKRIAAGALQTARKARN